MRRAAAERADLGRLARARAGWYPTTWSVRWDEQRHEYLVLLDGLRWRDASLPLPATLAAATDETSTSGH